MSAHAAPHTHAEEFDAHGHKDHGHVIVSIWTLRFVLITLLFFTFATVGAAAIEAWISSTLNVEIPQWLNVAVALSIAVVKTVLVVTFFMQLKYDNPLNTMIFVFTLITVAFFLGFTAMDLGQRKTIDRFKGQYIYEGGKLDMGGLPLGDIAERMKVPKLEDNVQSIVDLARFEQKNGIGRFAPGKHAGHGSSHDTHAHGGGHAPRESITNAGFSRPARPASTLVTAHRTTPTPMVVVTLHERASPTPAFPAPHPPAEATRTSAAPSWGSPFPSSLPPRPMVTETTPPTPPTITHRLRPNPPTSPPRPQPPHPPTPPRPQNTDPSCAAAVLSRQAPLCWCPHLPARFQIFSTHGTI